MDPNDRFRPFPADAVSQKDAPGGSVTFYIGVLLADDQVRLPMEEQAFVVRKGAAYVAGESEGKRRCYGDGIQLPQK